jgi:hypothetical protein
LTTRRTSAALANLGCRKEQTLAHPQTARHFIVEVCARVVLAQIIRAGIPIHTVRVVVATDPRITTQASAAVIGLTLRRATARVAIGLLGQTDPGVTVMPRHTLVIGGALAPTRHPIFTQ